MIDESQFFRRPGYLAAGVWAVAVPAVAAAMLCGGCDWELRPPGNRAGTTVPSSLSGVAEAAKYNELLDQARGQLERRELESAQRSLDELKQVEKELSDAQAVALQALETLLADCRAAAPGPMSEQAAGPAVTSADDPHTAAATTGHTPNESASGPDEPPQGDPYQDLDEDLRSEVLRLQAVVPRLTSESPEEVRAAQEELFENSDAALELLRHTLRDAEPQLVRNCLELLRRLDRPQDTLPIMLDVLRRPAQQQNWPDAVREITAMNRSGAGPGLLELVLSSDLPEQRLAVLDALAQVADPPPETLPALLPLVSANGPELAAALTAAYHAMEVHGQHELWSGRTVDAGLTPEQLKQLAALPERLREIASASAAPPRPEEAVHAARVLGIATRLFPAEPLSDVRILAFTAELKESPVAALLDGTWNSDATATMWRHPVELGGSVVFDLGTTRTVAGVRIWNLNQSGSAQRGWQEIAVYVGDAPALLVEPAAIGVVPQAPGQNDAPDYSTTLWVRFARGRFVRLHAQSFWQKDQYAGLSEVQILGF